MWPNYEDGTWPQYCNNTYGFDESTIADILPELKEAWYVCGALRSDVIHRGLGQQA